MSGKKNVLVLLINIVLPLGIRKLCGPYVIGKIRYLTNRMWFSIVCTLIDNDTRHHSGQNLLWTRLRLLSPQQILTTVMTRIVVDKSTDNAKPHSM